MFINKTNIKLLAAALLTALAAPSCLNLDETQDAGYGYLTISGLDVDVQVEQLVPTKAGETVDISQITGYSAPSLSSVTVTYKTDASKTYTWTSGETLKLPAGTYTLSATSGSNGFGAPYFVGSGEVTVPALKTAQGTVTFNLGNSVMKVTMADGFAEHFTPASSNPVKISDGSASVTPSMGQYVFVPSSKNLTVTVTGTSSAGVGKEYTINATPAAKTAYDVVLSTSGVTLPTISLSSSQVAWGDRIFITNEATFSGSISDANKGKIVYEAISASSSDWTNPSVATDGVITGLTTGTQYKVRARVGALVSNEITLAPAVTGLATTAAHTTTNNELDGTDVTTTFTSPATQVTDLISSWTYQLYKSDGTTLLREYTAADGTVTSDGSAITAADGWPYLPQGTYKLKATATLTDDKTVSSTMDLSVGAPSFTVTTRPVSSYTYYTNNNVDAANNSGIGGSAIWLETKVGIADNIIGNNNYTINLSGSFSTNSSKSGTLQSTKLESNIFIHKPTELTSLSWQEHKVTINNKVSFDNVEVTATASESSCHVTGFPYVLNPNSNDNWSESGNIKWNSDGTLRLGYNWSNWFASNTAYVEKNFYVPQNLYLKINASGTLRGSGGTNDSYQTTFTISVSNSSVYSVKSESGDYKSFTAADVAAEISAATPKVKLDNSYSTSEACTKISSLSLQYR